MEYQGSLRKQVEQWFNEHFTFNASHIPDTEEAYPSLKNSVRILLIQLNMMTLKSVWKT